MKFKEVVETLWTVFLIAVVFAMGFMWGKEHGYYKGYKEGYDARGLRVKQDDWYLTDKGFCIAADFICSYKGPEKHEARTK